MNLFTRLLRDESGLVLSAEAIVLGTVGVVGATAGLTAVSRSMNDELADVAFSIRSMDQSFQIAGDSRCGACIAGSKFTQRPVEESLKLLRDEYEKDEASEQKQLEEAAKKPGEKAAEKGADPQPPASKKPRKNRKMNKKNKTPKNQDEDLEIDAEKLNDTSDPTSV